MTPQGRFEAVGRWLAEVGGTSTPGEIGAAFELNGARQADVLRGLEDAGLIERAGRIVRLTADGWARFTGVGPGDAGAVLDRVLGDSWPGPHRALLELMVSAVPARHHLGASRPEPHLGFFGVGETATGKGAMGGLVCHLYGFDPVAATVHVPAETAGSLLGRREAVEGADESDRWRFVPGPATRLPFVLLDEFDKADAATRRAVWPYLDGRLRVQAEGRVHELLPTPLLTANPPKGDRYGDVPQEYRRRCVVLDTGFMRGRGRELERMLTAFYNGPVSGERLALESLVPPSVLHPDAIAWLDTVADALTDAGREEFPGVRALELATLGRCALLGPDADHVGAAIQTGIAYLTATATVEGQVEPGWELDVRAAREYLGDGGQFDQIEAAMRRARQATAAQHAVVEQSRHRKAKADLEIEAAGAQLQEKLRLLYEALDGRKMPDEHKPEAAGLRRNLKKIGAQAGQVSTERGLADLTAQAAEPAAKARRLIDEAARARELEARRRNEAREAERLSVRQVKADAEGLAQWQRAQQRASVTDAQRRLRLVTAAAKQLEPLYRRRATRPGENPLRVLAELRVGGGPVLIYRPPSKRPPAKGLRGVLEALAPAQGTWHTAHAGAVFPGTETSCTALSTWGPNTQAVLAPTLARLHHEEDLTREELGQALRTNRPVVTAMQLPEGRHLAAIAAR